MESGVRQLPRVRRSDKRNPASWIILEAGFLPVRAMFWENRTLCGNYG